MAKANESDVIHNVEDQFIEQVSEFSDPEPKFEAFDKSYTEEDLRKVREQEKSKLYPQIEKLKDELDSLKKEKNEEEAKKAAVEAEIAEKAKKKQEEELAVRELLTLKEQEFAAQLQAEREEREKAFALLDAERRFSELQNYRATRLEQERDNIIPELIDLIAGETPDEIESSIAGLKERSSRILDSAQQALASARRDMTGSRVTVPASGPLDTNSDQQSFTAEQIASMSMSEFAKNRGKLLGQAASERGQGLFS
jgi:chromosome segregation ATPase